MADEIVISVKNVGKSFCLPHEKKNSIKSIFTSLGKGSKHSYEVQHALRNISFDIKKGEFFGIVGRNGSGKSTLLKILAEIYQPTSGSVSVEGRLVPFIELGVGFNPELTGRENVYLSGALSGFTTTEMDAMYDDIVDFAELEEFMDQKLKNYSSGMQVRLAFSVATRAKADILLIDEVLAVGDADFQRKCFQYFRSLKKQKMTVVFVSHDMEAIREYCDRCIFIDHSELIFTGTSDSAAERYLKLFNTETAINPKNNEQSDRWGDGSARIKNVLIDQDNNKININAEVHFVKDMQSPIIGMLIKNSSGLTICGTNTKLVKIHTKDAKKGDVYSLRWEVPNIFSSDDYTVETAVSYADGVTQADWWHSAGFFTINNLENTPHSISPSIAMELDKNKA